MFLLRIFLFICLSFPGLVASSQTKVVLIEEGSGTWCQWCPRGTIRGHELANDHPGHVLLVAVHEGDPMEIAGLTYFNALNFVGLPNGHIDRSTGPLDPNSWPSQVPTFLNLVPPADIVVSRVYDAATRELDITVDANFFTTLSSGDYRLGALVVEDGVTGPAPDYAQSNAYIGGQNGLMGGYELLANPVPAGIMVFDHVARGLLSDFEGLAASLPSSPQSGQSYSANFSYIIPADQDPEYVRVYAYLSDVSSGAVLNAGSGEYALGDLNARPFFHSDSVVSAALSAPFSFNIRCHDPDNDTLTINTVAGLPAWANLGADGINDAILSGTPSASGSYNLTLEVSDGSKTRIQNLTINVSTATNNWVQVGQPAFSLGPSEYIAHSAYDPASDAVYSLLITPGGLIEIHKWDGSSWSLIGNPQAASWTRTGDIEVHPISGEPWLVYHTGAFYTQILRFTGGMWTPVGNILEGNLDPDLEFSSTGTPYVCVTRNSVGTTVYDWDGSAWNAVGGGMLTLAGSPLINSGRLELDNNDQPTILVNTFLGLLGYSTVLSYDGTTWIELNGGVINPSTPTIESLSIEHELVTGANGEVYVILGHYTGSNVYAYNGSGWDTLAVNIDGGVRKVFDLRIGQNDVLYALYQNTQGGLSCEAWDGTNWSFLGLPNFAPLSASADMYVYSNGLPGVVYIDAAQGGKLSAQRYNDPSIGIEEIASETGFVYPNPCRSKLFIEDGALDAKYYLIFDQQGKIQASDVLKNGSLGVSFLSEGLYTISFPALNKAYRFVKQ